MTILYENYQPWREKMLIFKNFLTGLCTRGLFLCNTELYQLPQFSVNTEKQAVLYMLLTEPFVLSIHEAKILFDSY